MRHCLFLLRFISRTRLKMTENFDVQRGHTVFMLEYIIGATRIILRYLVQVINHLLKGHFPHFLCFLKFWQNPRPLLYRSQIVTTRQDTTQPKKNRHKKRRPTDKKDPLSFKLTN